MIDIQIRPYYRKKLDPAILEKAANAALLAEKLSGNVSLLVTGNKEIRELNKTYRDTDSPTDVLSFEEKIVDPVSGETYYGDIIISFPQARDQAREENHTLNDELMLLAVHGVLHLLGYDHHKPAQRKVMWKRQEEILASLGVQSGVLDYLEKA
jgi:probable rRNA maturation factor